MKHLITVFIAALSLISAAAFAQSDAGISGSNFSASQTYNWSAIQNFQAITATTVNGVTISPTANPATINLQPGASNIGSIQIGANQGTIGAEAIAIGLSTANQMTGGCGGCVLIGQSILLSSTAAGGVTAVGNDCDKFYTMPNATTCMGASAAKNQVSGGNSVWIGDGAGINFNFTSGASNTNTVVGGNNTLAGTANTSLTVARNEVFGGNIATAISANFTDNILMGANMLGTLTGGSHLVWICTYTSSCPNPAANNTFTLEGVINGSGTGTPSTSTVSIAGNLAVVGTPSFGVFTGTPCVNNGFLTINDAAGTARKVMICT